MRIHHEGSKTRRLKRILILRCAKEWDHELREKSDMRTVIRKRYSSEFKAQAVEMLNTGRSVPEVAEELGIGNSILYRWALAATPTQLLGAAQRAEGEMSEAEELRRLRKQNARLLMENDILKKAAVILGSPPLSKPAR
jgi:transposase